MSESNPNGDSAHFPRHHRPRGRGQSQSQISSDSTLAPQTAPRQNRDHSPHEQKRDFALTGTVQTISRQSDPFYYDSQRIPYWDDSTGIIHDLPTSPSRQKEKSKGQYIAGCDNPYAEIVGGGPYSQQLDASNHAAMVRDWPYAHETRPDQTNASHFDILAEHSITNEDAESRIRSWLDSEEASNDGNTERSIKGRFRRALRKKDANQTLHQRATETIKVAVAKRRVKGDAEPGSLVIVDVPGDAVEKNRNLRTATTRLDFRHRLVTPTPPNFSKSGASYGLLRTDTRFETRLPLATEAPSPSKAFDKQQETVRGIENTPTLDRVIELRAEEQSKVLALLKGRLSEPGKSHGDEGKLSGDLTQSIMNPDVPNDDGSQGMKSIVPDHLDGNYASSSMYSSNENDDFEELAKAVAGLRPFQKLPSPSKLNSFQRHSAIPGGLDLLKIQAAKKKQVEVPNECEEQEAPQNIIGSEAEVGLPEAPVDMDTFASHAGADTQSRAHTSDESLATMLSEGYNQIGRQESLQMEHNGVKRRWYRGFWKV